MAMINRIGFEPRLPKKLDKETTLPDKKLKNLGLVKESKYDKVVRIIEEGSPEEYPKHSEVEERVRDRKVRFRPT